MKNSAVLFRIKSTDMGYFQYRRQDQKQYSKWDAYKPTKSEKSQLPKEFFSLLKKEIRERGRRLENLQKAVECTGRKLGFEVFSDTRRNRPRLVIWAGKRGDGRLDAVAAFGILHSRWKEREKDTEWDRKRKRKMTYFVRHCKAWLRFIVDNSTSYPVTNLKKKSLRSWKSGCSEIQQRLFHLDSLAEKGQTSFLGQTTSSVSMEQINPTLRFPRLEGITEAVRLRERLLWRTYNRLRPSRGGWRKSRTYDVYKIKNRNYGHYAQIEFLILAGKLLKRNIDPIRYLKVMCQKRRHNRNFLPHPTWLASDKAIKQYEWLQYAQTNRADREEEWQRLRGSFHSRDILLAIEQAAKFIKGAEKDFKMTEPEAVTAFIWEANPWFLSAYVGSAPRKQADLVAQLAKTNTETHKSIMSCLRFFMENKSIWRRAKQTLLQNLE